MDVSAQATARTKPNLGKFVVDVLNGESLGIVITLIPAALISSLLKLFGDAQWATQAGFMVSLAQSLLPVVSAFAVAAILKLAVIDAASIALAAFVSAGVVTQTPNGMVIGGTGVILNILLVIFVATGMTIAIKNSFGHFKMLIQPLLVIIVAGGFGLLTLAPMAAVQTIVGQMVTTATALTPIVMGIVLGAAFAFLILSPLSSVGIATAIGLAGIGSGAANAGIVVAAFTLAAMGSSVNPIGASLATFLGSPKVQMANLLTKPKLFIAPLIGAGIMGGVATLFNIEGTAYSAGFGFAGLIGPITAYTTAGGGTQALISIVLVFGILPVALACALKYVFINKLGLIKPEDLKITLE
ncbi:PTS sugar transporter subunit IIC [Periweissella cryptocerci]|uniref:PTS sugar transporter subunit IIC n=1 Tax=Periweissella cryptocerci TaxID=2506420 RepID=A0A4P6YVP5_9LACO|nr:PTS sugar transporter subunit IIC [Periweissella cryptocerci]QBO36826.1 PTS sugar transporter subunit IIC [Periweissella cryptocerci]